MNKWTNKQQIAELENKTYQNFFYNGENIIGIVTPKEQWKMDYQYMLDYLINKIDRMENNPCSNMFGDKIAKTKKQLKQLQNAVKKIQ